MDCQDAKQWIAFVGFDIPVRQSGRWKGHGKLSKRGNPYLRKRLFNAAWGAVRNDEDFHRYYVRLREEGRSYRETMVIISRTVLRILFAVQKTGTPYAAEDCRAAA